jgi:ABC-type uncharacterized transport system substrate-binding protein
VIEYRWADGQYDLMPGLVADLVRRQVAVIATTGAVEAALAAKRATTTIPIVFTTGGDPVKAGLVAALNKPGGNITGVTTMNAELGSKWVGLMRDLLPKATRFALLVNPGARINSAEMVAGTQDAAAAIGLQIEVVYAGTRSELETALAGVAQKQAGALMIVPDALFLDAGVAIMRGRNELEEFQHLPGCDGLPFCGCIEAAIRRRCPDELASLTEDAVCGALYGWVMAEFDDSPEGKAFAAEMEEMRARRDD